MTKAAALPAAAPLVDPMKEPKAQETRLASHTTTLAEESAKRGQDWEAHLRQRAKELELMRELGLDAAAAVPAADDEERERRRSSGG